MFTRIYLFKPKVQVKNISQYIRQCQHRVTLILFLYNFFFYQLEKARHMVTQYSINFCFIIKKIDKKILELKYIYITALNAKLEQFALGTCFDVFFLIILRPYTTIATIFHEFCGRTMTYCYSLVATYNITCRHSIKI